ncbi:MAG: hypothetical protein JWP58_2657 [Hymenobacter sp.]|nr:hypothetical protein [Hymenobacter sp.]
MRPISPRKLTRWLLPALTALLALPAAAQAPAWQWGLQTTNPTPLDGTETVPYAVAADASGRAYVGGTLSFQSTPVINVTRSFGSAGTFGPGQGGFVAQATAAGSWAWYTAVKPLGSSSVGIQFAKVTAVAVAPTGDVYAAGYADAATLQVGSVNEPLGSSGRAVFVARFSSAGVCQWLRPVESADTDPLLAFDPSTGGVVLAGTYDNSPSFGTVTLPTGAGALFVARLSPTGQWTGAAVTTGTPNLTSYYTMAVGPAGQVAVAGSRRAGSLTFGSATLTSTTPNGASYFVAQLSPANVWQWAAGGSGSRLNSIYALAYTPAGALWVSGSGMDGTVVGPTTLSTGTPAAADCQTGFVGQLSATGQWGTVQQLAASGNAYSVFTDLQSDAAGNALVLGGLRGLGATTQAQLGSHTLFGPGTGILYFAARLTGTGQWQHLADVPAPTAGGQFEPTDMALDGGGNLYLGGALRGSLPVGTGTLQGTSNGNATTPHGYDAVLLRLTNATALASRAAPAAPALACYPNPAHAAATLRLPAPAEAATATLTDALGRPVRTYALPAHAPTATLDLTGLAPGLYALRCGTASGRLVVE